MTSAAQPSKPASATPTLVEASDVTQSGWRNRIEVLLDRASEQLNPILIKEARQALKSRQFVITFSLLLGCGWAWSLLGVALLSPGVYFAPGGRFMLVGYFIVLAVPVLLVVPYTAFRSLASEREDGTFELLSITTLSARQIVTGKLGSATIQMLVYYSALAPCIAFTYLLRGVDILTILFVLFATFFASVLLSSAGLVIGTLTQARHWQVVLAVLLLVALLTVTIVWCVLFIQVIAAGESLPFDQSEFWTIMAAVVTIAGSFLLLFVFVAAAQIRFASDNRSTRLRIVMLFQQVLWIGWMMYFWIDFQGDEILYALVSVASLYWFAVGSLLMGETAPLSPRVRRSLPQSFLGRTMFTWFNPGSGTGYVFAVTNLMALVVLAIVANAIAVNAGRPGADGDWVLFTLMATGYVAAYLGVARLLVLLFRRIGQTGLFLSFLIAMFLAVLGAALPAILQAWQQGYGRLVYSVFQTTNWVWTLAECDSGSYFVVSSGVPFIVLGGATAIFVLNLVFARFEVEQVRQETPARVLADPSNRRWIS
ncbi:MAG: hypothetical protein ACC628_00450 [Pirellulaceae bacterium]